MVGLSNFSNDVFRSELSEFFYYSKSIKFEKTKGYSLAFFSENELF